MRTPASYFSLVEDYAAATAVLSSLTRTDAEQASREILELALRLLARDASTRDHLEQIAIWHADKFYRLVNQIEALDASSLLFMRAVGGAFTAVMKQHDLSIAYLVDNQIPMDRMRGLNAAFSSLGFVVASPELFVEPLLEATPGATRAQVYGEAVSVAAEQYRTAIEERANVLWTSGDVPLAILEQLAGLLDEHRCVGVFRNEAPTDGSEVQVFVGAGRREPLRG